MNGIPRIAAAICSFERYELLAQAIESVAVQDLGAGNFRVLVVDNSPDPDRARLFSGRFRHLAGFTYLHEMTPGLSHARNLAARACGTEFIAFLDDDATAAPGWLRELLRAFDHCGEKAAIVGGKVEPVWGAPRPRWLHDKLLGSLSLIDWGGDLRIAEPHEWLCGANIAFRTQAITDYGGFDVNLGRKGQGGMLMSNEEVNLVRQIRARGGRQIYAPAAVVRHLVDPRRLTRAWFRKRAAWQATSDFLMEPEKFAARGREQWETVRGYFAARPPHERTLRGLLIDTDDPELFRWQLDTYYTLTAGLLAGFEGVKLD